MTWLWVIAAAWLCVSAGLIFRMATNYGEIVIRSSDPSAKVVLTQGKHQQQFEIENGERKIKVRVGEYDLSVTGDAELSIEPKSVSVARNSSSDIMVQGKTDAIGTQKANQPLAADSVESQLLSLMLQQQGLRERFGPQHPEMMSVAKQIDRIRRFQAETADPRIEDELAKDPNYYSLKKEISTLRTQLDRSETPQAEQATLTADLKSKEQQLNQRAAELYPRIASRLAEMNENKDIVQPLSRVYINVRGTIPDRPIDGVYQVEGSGNVHLGPPYGRVAIGGLSLVVAEKTLEEAMRQFLKDPEVMVTWPGPRDSKVDPKLMAASPTGPIYHGESYESWMQQLQSTHDASRILEFMQGITQLGEGRPTETATGILQAMRKQGVHVGYEAVGLIATLSPQVVVDAMLQELEQGNARSRDFVLLVVQSVTERRHNEKNGDFQRLRIVLRKRAAQIADARLQNPKDLGVERISAEALVAHLILHCGLSDQDPDRVELLRKAIDREIDHHNVKHMGQVVHALALIAPSTPGLPEKLVKVKRAIDSDRMMAGSYQDRFAQVVGLLGPHAEPILEEMLDELQLALDGSRGGMISIPKPGRTNPIIETLGAIGPPARAAEDTLTTLVQLGNTHATMRRTSRLAAEALRKIKGE